MAASTKLVLLVLALLFGVSILFYGVMFDGDDAGDLDVAAPAAVTADDAPAESGPAADAPRERPSLAAGGERPSLGANVRRPSLNAAATPASPSGRQPGAGSPAGEDTARPSLGGAARRPLVAARPAPGQIEMGAGRGPLAGGTRLPAPPATTPRESEPPPSAARPLARPETARPSLGGSTARPSLSAPPPSSGTSAAGPAPASPSPSPPARATRASTPPADPADVLVSRYTIRKGDTLSAIAARHLGAARHWPLIRDANPGIDLTRLQVGQRILLPPRAAVTRERAAGTSTPSSGTTTSRTETLRPGEVMHEVRAGETLSSIAAERLGAAKHWRLIADRNRDLLGGDPDRLKVGMTLRVPPKPRD